MAGNFFGFNTGLKDDIADHLPGDPRQVLAEEEDEYDALNDETFGSEAIAEDWEEDHEKLVEITEWSKITRSIRHYSDSRGIEHEGATFVTRQRENTELDLEAQISHLVLEDNDSDNDDYSGAAFSAAVNYSSSAPSCYSVWEVEHLEMSNAHAAHVFTDTQSAGFKMGQPVLPDGKKVRTVEELERDLLSKNSASSTVIHPGMVHVEDLERELQAPSRGFKGIKPSQSDTCTSIGSQEIFFSSCQSGLITNEAPSPMRPPYFPPEGSLHTSVQSTPRPNLDRSSVMPNVVSSPFAGLPDIRQMRPQSQRIIMPRMILQQQPQQTPLPQQQQQQKQQKASISGSESQLFPVDNSLLQTAYHRADSQGPGSDQHHLNRGVTPGHFHHRGSDWGPHFHSHNVHQLNQGYLDRGYSGFLHSSYNGCGPGDDDYAGLMTPREKQWLMNIQHMQLNTTQPFVDDYYYKMFIVKREKKNTENFNQQHESKDEVVNKDIPCVDEQHGNSTTDIHNSSHRNTPAHFQQQDVPSSSQGCNKAYIPTQFENSLGKLQIGSVTAPRKVIDMDVVSPDSIDPPIQVLLKDSRRSIQLLLTIEWMYGVLLQVEALASPIPELRETSRGDKVELLHKLLKKLLGSEPDVLLNVMCVSKGKGLILRLLHQMKLPEMESEMGSIFYKMFRRLVTIGRRDGDNGILLKYLTVFEQFLGTARTSTFLMLIKALNSPNDRYYNITGTGRNTVVYALSSKFGTAVISLLLKYSAIKNPYASLSGFEDWTNFIDNLLCAAKVVLPRSSSEYIPVGLTPELFHQILNSCSASQNQSDSLRRVLLGEKETITEK